jgi:hypothetical protein
MCQKKMELLSKANIKKSEIVAVVNQSNLLAAKEQYKLIQ